MSYIIDMLVEVFYFELLNLFIFFYRHAEIMLNVINNWIGEGKEPRYKFGYEAL